MAISEALQKMRGSPAEFDSQGLQPPLVDPVSIIAGMIGPAIMKSLLSGGLAEAAPEGFSQIDAMLSRLKANEPKIRGGMVGDELLKKSRETMGIDFGLPPSGTIDRAVHPQGTEMPPLEDPLAWLEHPQFWERKGMPFASGYPDWLRAMGKLMKGQGTRN